ncbi:MAG: hypothetical protein DSZ03_08110 [Sulfurimonas sp.]|nr:MAG: hypothetical protein DSZ03_08110 [Sulfurimonas sp.]
MMMLWLTSVFAEDAIFCEVLGTQSKRIQCTFFTQSVSFDRNITFYWESPDDAYDYRQRDFTIEAHHLSVYDYRYYYGRAAGVWNIFVKDDTGETLAHTTFELHHNEELPLK